MEMILRGIKRPYSIQYDDQEHKSLDTIPEGAQITITLPGIKVKTERVENTSKTLLGTELKVGESYTIKVRQYMTKPSSPDFDFMDKWNKNIPMPFRIMTGKVIKETRGMVMMDLHCEPIQTDVCMRCGRTLTHPVSRLYGIGPECGGHAHINPFDTEEQLRDALEDVRAKLADIKWTGWVIKSAIEFAKMNLKEEDD